MNATIGRRIRKYREEKGFSQEELAGQLHISRSTYQRIENGETNSWINHIENICNSLDVNMEDILKPEEGYTQINKENSANENSSNNMIQNQTNNYSSSEKLLEQYEGRIKELKEQVSYWKSKAEGQ
ncbi:helix-turn-helix transcriptional regulator [uncultured Chryseobacterium sp.]|uniref:helix-turn-helix transcriptional regulator n=1 Tax=uncultured Chryseobacterium sp. TaxID=259322 RepID=UPI003749CB99